MKMFDLIRHLEGQTDLRRRELLLQQMALRKWDFQLQEYIYSGQSGCNIIVDINDVPDPSILLVAHYDCFAGSPGANDDASAIAVLIDAAERLQLESLEYHLRIVFFDDEEPTHLWNEPVGSRIYVEEFGVRNLHAVLDFEMCGMGDAVGIWPVEGIEDQPILKQITNMMDRLKMPWDFGKRIPGFYADYLPFRRAGLLDSYCFTSFHWNERERVRQFSEGTYKSLLLRYAAWRLFRLPMIPKIFRHYHTASDRSEFLSEKTLERMSDLVYRMVMQLNFPSRS
ncbi:M28 family metallopeptidase [bacterium]|nr:M28 family metallopeptidase [bacterium]